MIDEALVRRRPADRESGGRASPPASSRSDDGEQRAQNVVLYVRGSTANPERERGVIRTLEALSADEIIDGYEVRTWPERVSCGPGGDNRAGLRATFDAFEEWAEERGLSIRPPFIVREIQSVFTAEHDEVLITPMLFMAVFDGDAIVGTYPCHHADGVVTIDDWLARMGQPGTGEMNPGTGRPDRPRPTEPEGN